MGYSNITDWLKKNKLISEFLTPKAFRQFSKYIISGFTAAAVEYGTFQMLINYFKQQLAVSNSISMGMGFLVSFIMNKFWSFQSKDNALKQFVLTLVLFFINLGISNALIYLFTLYFNIGASISKIIVMGIIVVWNFILYKKIIYR